MQRAELCADPVWRNVGGTWRERVLFLTSTSAGGAKCEEQRTKYYMCTQ